MFEELNAYGPGYKPVQGGYLPGPEALPDGTATFEVIDAALMKTPQTGDIVFRMRLKVLNGPQAGIVIERASFLNRSEAVDRLGGDFLTLGVMSAKDWGKSAPLSACIPRDALFLAGRRFSGNKTTTTKEGGFGQPPSTYHNLHINSAIGGTRPPENSSTPAQSPGYDAGRPQEAEHIPF